MSRQLEQTLQEQFVWWLRNYKSTTGEDVLFCASAGGMHTPNKRAAMRMKRAGYVAGFPDVFIYEPRGGWNGMAVEVKVKSYASAEQKAWREYLLRRGYYAVIVPGKFDCWEARNFLESETDNYLKGRIVFKKGV